MEEIFLPTLHYFENNNRFSGSAGMLRFMLTPKVEMLTPKEVNLEASSIHGQLWHGLYCLEKSTVEEEQDFPMSHDGLEAIHQWLEAHR
jgi:hypothetical protein